MFMTSDDFRESLRRYNPRVFCDGDRIESVADEPRFRPGVDAIGVTYDFALEEDYRPLMVAEQHTTGQDVNRMLHICRTPQDLINKLEAVRLLCREVGCAQRYLTHDALNAIYQATYRIDEDKGTETHQRFLNYLHKTQDEDLTLGVAMTDGKGDRKLRPADQPNPDSYVHIKERRADGVIIRGAKAIITAAPYVHEYLVMPGRNMTEADAEFAICCAIPVDTEGITIVSRPAGRHDDASAKFSAKYGQATGVAIFDDVFVPWDRVFMAGEWEHSQFLTSTYATHHRHSCIGARAGFGDLLIGGGVMMSEANGLSVEATPHLRDSMVELIKIVEGFYACGVAASVYGFADPAGSFQPDGVFANVGKLMMATQIYDMHRIAHEVSGGLIVALPGPDEDHNPETAGDLSTMLQARADIPHGHRAEVARFMEDLTASKTGSWMSVISLHGGGSPAAMKREIYRYYPIEERVQLVEKLLDRDVLAEDGKRVSKQPGRCCPVGCQVPETPQLDYKPDDTPRLEKLDPAAE
ncbi:MAG: 4-hydroxyphenylacetate 3-hydroxylase family protein [Alphaproteobacteria bacterium]